MVSLSGGTGPCSASASLSSPTGRPYGLEDFIHPVASSGLVSANPTQPQVFFTKIEPLLPYWASVELRYSAILQAGEWRNLLSRARLGWEKVDEPVAEILLDDERFRAGRVLMGLSGALPALKASEDGFVRMRDVSFKLDYLSSRSNPPGTPSKYGWTCWMYETSGGLRNLEWGTFEGNQGYHLAAHGGQLREIVDIDEWTRIHDLLLDGNPPYTSIEDFSTTFLGFRQEQTYNHVAAFELEAMLPISFADWDLVSPETFTAKVRSAPTVRASDLKTVAVLTSQDRTDRLKVECTPVSSDSLGWNDSVVTIPFRGYSWVDLHLLLQKSEVDVLRGAFPATGTDNLRFRSLAPFPRLTQLLNETLEQAHTITSSDRQEILVSWILHLCGFQTMLTDVDGMKAGDAPDLLAFDPYSTSNVLVVEVTGRDPLNHDKASKLRRRTDELGVALAGSKPRAVLVLPGRDSLLDLEIEIAERLSIALLTRPKVWQLIRLAQENTLPARVTTELIDRWRDST